MARIEFGGTIGNDWRDSEPWWPPLPSPPAGAPNVVLIVLDDVGFAQLGCYGSDIATPVIDGIASGGVRLTNFHTTALCSPTRACLLTGRNHHRSGMGRVADLATGFPGYWGRPPRENGFLSEILRANGYATYAVGKWHLTPEDETNMARSRSTWPLGRGFDRWYGFHGGETHQFVPGLYHDNHIVRPPRTIEEGYHLSQDLADRAIEYLGDLRAVDDELPFFLYFATGACHSPHHAPAEWIERYKGHFAKGWDRWRDEILARQLATGVVPEGTTLSPRPPWVPAWDTLDEHERALSERFMECFAAFLSYTDEQIGRVLDLVDEIGDGDNTVVILVSDNGASSEGGKEGTINEGRLSKFRRRRRGRDVPAHRRDRRSPQSQQLPVGLDHGREHTVQAIEARGARRRRGRSLHCQAARAGAAASAGGLRRQYAHAVDILPTVLELVGVAEPAEIDGIEQSRIDGTSFAYVLDEAGERAPGRHHTQHFEMLGSRAIYHDGWKAVTFHPVGPLYDDGLRSNAPFDDDVWELYHVAEDVSEIHDRAAEFPEKVDELVALWWEEARRNDVLPLDNRVLDAMSHKHDRRRYQDTYRYFQGGAQVPEWVAVDVRNRSHAIAVDIETPPGVAPEGTLLALGSRWVVGRSTCSMIGSATCTTSTVRRTTKWSPPARLHRAATPSSSVSKRTRAPAVWRPSSLTATRSAKPRSRSSHRSPSTRSASASHAATSGVQRSDRATRRRSPSTARSGAPRSLRLVRLCTTRWRTSPPFSRHSDLRARDGAVPASRYRLSVQ